MPLTLEVLLLHMNAMFSEYLILRAALCTMYIIQRYVICDSCYIQWILGAALYIIQWYVIFDMWQQLYSVNIWLCGDKTQVWRVDACAISWWETVRSSHMRKVLLVTMVTFVWLFSTVSFQISPQNVCKRGCKATLSMHVRSRDKKQLVGSHKRKMLPCPRLVTFLIELMSWVSSFFYSS